MLFALLSQEDGKKMDLRDSAREDAISIECVMIQELSKEDCANIIFGTWDSLAASMKSPAFLRSCHELLLAAFASGIYLRGHGLESFSAFHWQPRCS